MKPRSASRSCLLSMVSTTNAGWDANRLGASRFRNESRAEGRATLTSFAIDRSNSSRGLYLKDIGQRETVNRRSGEFAQGLPDVCGYRRDAIQSVPDRLEVLFLQVLRHGGFVEVTAEQQLREKVVRSRRQLSDDVLG